MGQGQRKYATDKALTHTHIEFWTLILFPGNWFKVTTHLLCSLALYWWSSGSCSEKGGFPTLILNPENWFKVTGTLFAWFKSNYSLKGEKSIFKAAWTDFLLAFTVSNTFPYNPNIQESYRLLPFYTSRIGLPSKLKIFKVNQIFSSLATKKTNQTALWGCLKKTFGFVLQMISFI